MLRLFGYIREFRSRAGRQMRDSRNLVSRIKELSDVYRAKSEDDLMESTDLLRRRIANGGTLDDILPDAFAAVREASRRIPPYGSTVGLVHHDVQIAAGIALHRGLIVEMDTGEGKTLVATCPAYLNALAGRGVHVITVNDYLARRDSQWMGPIYRALGCTFGCIQHAMDEAERRNAYQADITYATASELVMDFLRDNMVTAARERIQRHHVAIIDDVDNILIDEARNPLLLTTHLETDRSVFERADSVARRLKLNRHFTREDSGPQLTDEGIRAAQKLLSIDDFYCGQAKDHAWPDLIMQALAAHHYHARGRSYIVDERGIVPIDPVKCRPMPGNRYANGLHSAIEQKEGLEVQPERVPCAKITIQAYFRGYYSKLCGMSATVKTEEDEFREVYDLDVFQIPPNIPNIRQDCDDIVYKTAAEKLRAIVADIESEHRSSRPILIGTPTQDEAENLSRALLRKGIRHAVLSAKNHEKEAVIVETAGSAGAVTIVTLMAARGTDIRLGPGVRELNGLLVIGTQHNDARRIDLQLRGRAARQGDPGETRFYCSLDDPLMRLFGSDRVAKIMDRMGAEEDEPIIHGLVTKAIVTAQKRLESRDFQIRKTLLALDSIMDDQRRQIYEWRNVALDTEQPVMSLFEKFRDALGHAITDHLPTGSEFDDRYLEMLAEYLEARLHIRIQAEIMSIFPRSQRQVFGRLVTHFADIFRRHVEHLTPEHAEFAARFAMLRSIDDHWRADLHELIVHEAQIRAAATGISDVLVQHAQRANQRFKTLKQTICIGAYSMFLRIELQQQEESP